MVPTSPSGCTAVVFGTFITILLAVFAVTLFLGGSDPEVVQLFGPDSPESGGTPSVEFRSLLDDLDHAEALWDASGIDSYRIQVRTGGAWRLNTYTITVRNGLVAGVEIDCAPGMTGLKNCPEDVVAAAEDFTVAGMFAQLQAGIVRDDGAYLAAEFDPAYGYPTSMRFDHPAIFDEEWFVTVLSFEVLPE